MIRNCGINYGVTITILPTSNGIAVNLNIGKKLNWIVMCAELGDVTEEEINDLREGLCIVLFKSINKGLRLTLTELIAHNCGNIVHSELGTIEELANEHSDYFKNL